MLSMLCDTGHLLHLVHGVLAKVLLDHFGLDLSDLKHIVEEKAESTRGDDTVAR